MAKMSRQLSLCTWPDNSNLWHTPLRQPMPQWERIHSMDAFSMKESAIHVDALVLETWMLRNDMDMDNCMKQEVFDVHPFNIEKVLMNDM